MRAKTCRLAIANGPPTTGNIRKRQLTLQKSQVAAEVVEDIEQGSWPEDVLVLIYNHLQRDNPYCYEDLILSNARTVCRTWRDAARSCNIMLHLQITVDHITPRAVAEKARVAPTKYSLPRRRL